MSPLKANKYSHIGHQNILKAKNEQLKQCGQMCQKQQNIGTSCIEGGTTSIIN